MLFLAFDNYHLRPDRLLHGLTIHVVGKSKCDLRLCELDNLSQVESKVKLILQIFGRLHENLGSDVRLELAHAPYGRLEFVCFSLTL